MVNINAILAALFCATAPVASVVGTDPKTEVVQPGFQLGKEKISTIRGAYEKGGYQSFFKEMDASYEKADLSGLIQMRQSQVPVEFQEECEQQFLDLQKERNQKLLSALADTDDSSFAKKVRGSALNLLTSSQEKALSKINSFIAMAPNTGANADENALIKINLEYEYKSLHADLPAKDLSSQERQTQYLALRMEQMDKMLEASKHFQDLELKQAVGIAADTLDARLARNLDGSDLNTLLKSKTKPANATEEKVFSILSLYQGKFSDLLKELDQANR